MANLKNIADLPVAESVENLNLIVNENGSAKQIASSAVGAQADFAVTDETSPAFIKNKPEVAQSDWSVEDSSNPAFIKNKPFYDTREFETITVTFNGDLAEKEFVQIDDNFGFIKLSDKIPSKEELIGGILKTTAPDGVQTLEITEEMFMMQDGVIEVAPDSSDGAPAFMIIPQELITDNMPFTSAGVWAICGLADGAPVFYVSELSWNSVISGELKKIDRKYTQSGVFYTMYNGALLYDNGDMVPFSEVKESFANGVVRYKWFDYPTNIGTVIGYCPNNGYIQLLCDDIAGGRSALITPYVIE